MAEAVRSAAEKPLTATTISTIAVQTGRTRIVLAVLKHKNALHLRVQEMDPAITDIGKTLEEALEFQKEHNECLDKLLAKQPNVEELLAQADELISTQQPKREVYGAMADSLGQAWRDLNDLLEYRRLLLERAVGFHKQVAECNQKLTDTQRDMEKDMDSYVGSAKDWLKEHESVRKDILESSMRLLGDAQGLVEHINELGRIPAADSRGYKHATSAACHVVEELLETIHDRRRKLEELWQRRRATLLTHQKLISLKESMEKLRRMFQELQTADQRFNTLGNNLDQTKAILIDHQLLENRTKELYDFSQQLRRLHAQISPCPPEVDRDFQHLVDQIEKFYLRVDRRRYVLTMTQEFYQHVEEVFVEFARTDQQLSDLEAQKEQITPADIGNRQRALLEQMKAFTSPVFHEGQVVVERVEGMDSSGVDAALAAMQESLNRLTGRCTAFQTLLSKRSEIYRSFTQIYTSLYEWTVHVVEVLLKNHGILPTSLNGTRDFVDLHEQLYDEMKSRESEMNAFVTLVANVLKSPDGLDQSEIKEIAEKSEELQKRWTDLNQMLTARLEIVMPYADFQKVASKVSAEIDVLRSLSSLFNEDPSSELNASNFEQRLTSLHELITTMQNRASEFFKKSVQGERAQLDVSQAALAINEILERLQQDLKNFASVTQFSQNIRQKKTQWREYIEEVSTTITHIIRTEREAFQGLQLGYLGANQEEARQLQTKVEAFEPTINEVRQKVERLIQTAKDTPVDTDTAPERDIVVNDLIKAYERFVLRIEEYKILLKMAIDFYGRVNELEKVMREYENMVNMNLPSGVTETEQIIHRHFEQRQYISRVYEEVVHLGDSIINRIRQNYPQSIDLDTFHTSILDQRQTWDRVWTQQNQLLQSHLDVMKVRKEADELRQKIVELTDQMNRRKEETGESLQGAKRLFEVHSIFVKTVEFISTKVDNFVSTVDSFVSKPENAAQFSDLQPAKQEIQKLWSSFSRDVTNVTKKTELAVQYYEVLEEAEQWFKEATQALVTIGRKTTECKGPEDANNVLSQMENFLGPGEKKQTERVSKLNELSLQVFGAKGPSRVEYLVNKNKDIMESFSVISNELFSIAENLHAKVVKSTRAKSADEHEAGQPPAKTQKIEDRDIPIQVEQGQTLPSGPPVAQKTQLQPTVFVEKLQDVQIMAGQPVTLRCRVAGLPTPVVRWFRDGLPVSSNPDYVPHFNAETGESTLSINETFGEDSGVFSCSAENSGGMAVTECILNIREKLQPTEQMTPPVFLRTPQDAIAVEGSGLQFECQVSGFPKPVTAWFKNGNEVIPGQSKLIVGPPDDQGVTTLTIPNAGVEDQGVYECKATNPRGVATCSISFSSKSKTGEEAPFFTKLLSNVSAESGELVKLECHVSGIPLPDLEWTQNNQILHDSRNRVVKFDGKIATLVIFEYSPANSGTYICKARNKLGEALTTCSVEPNPKSVPRTPESTPEPNTVKPEIKKPLSPSAEIRQGQVLSLETIIQAPPQSEVQWLKNGNVLVANVKILLGREPSGAQPNTSKHFLVIKNPEPSDQGEYVCIVRNAAGEVATGYVVQFPQEITSPQDFATETIETVTTTTTEIREIPATVTSVGPAAVKPELALPLPQVLDIQEGEMVKLESVIISHPEAEVQWLKNGNVLVANVDIIMGKEKLQQNPLADRHWLVISKPRVEDSGEYICVAKNPEGEVLSQCVVTVNEKPPGPPVAPKPIPSFKPEFSPALPVHVEVTQEQERLQLETVVQAHPDSEVRWLKNGNIVVANVNIIIGKEPLGSNPQVERHYLVITNPTPSDSGKYVCVAKNSQGESQTACTVKVNPLPVTESRIPPPLVAPKPAKPEIAKPLSPKIETEPGQALRLETVVKSFPESQVQWLKNGNVIVANVDIIIGKKRVKVGTPQEEDQHFLIINNPTVADSGEYFCVARNEEGEVVSKCSVVVTESVQLQSAPESLVQHVEEVSQPPAVSPKPHGPSLYDRKEIIRIEETNVYRYEGISADLEPPRFSELLVDQSVEEGHPLRLKCHVSGTEPLDIKWFKDDVEIPSHADYKTLYDKSTGQCVLEIPEVFAEDAGVFMIQAINEAGIGKCYCNLKVADLISTTTDTVVRQPVVKEIQNPPQFVQLFRDQTAYQGKAITLTCVIAGQQTEVQWFKDGILLSPADNDIQVHGQKHSLTIPNSQPHHTGRYVCQADNPQGKATCSAQVAVQPYVEPKPMAPAPNFSLVEKNFSLEGPLRPTMETVEKFKTTERLTSSAPAPWIPTVKPSVVLVVPTKWVPEGLSQPPKMTKIDQNVSLDQILTHERPYVPGEPLEITPWSSVLGNKYEAQKAPGVVWSAPQIEQAPYHTAPPPVQPWKSQPTASQSYRTATPPGKPWVATPPQNETLQTAAVFQPATAPKPQMVRPQTPPSRGRVDFLPTTHVKSSDISPPTFPLKLLSKGVRPGEKVVFEARVAGVPTPSVQWFRDNTPIKNSPDFQITQRADLHQLIIPEAFPADVGHYKIRALNPAGEGICIAELVILQPNQFLREGGLEEFFTTSSSSAPQQHPTLGGSPHFTKTLFPQNVSERHRVVLECAVEASQPVTVQWFRNNVEIKPSPDYQQTQRNGLLTLVIPEAYPEDSGEYSCRVTNSLGSRHSSGFLTVEPSIPTSALVGPKKAAKPKNPQIQASNVVYGNAVSDHSDVEIADALADKRQSRPRGTSSGSDFIEYRESSRSRTVESEASTDMNGYLSSTGMEPPRFVQIVAPARAFEGGEVQLQARVTSNPRPSISWMKNGQRLPTTSARHSYFQEGEFIGLNVRMALKEDSGNYTVIAENPFGQDSCSAAVTVEEKQRGSMTRLSSQNDSNQVVNLRPREMSNGRRLPEEEIFDKSMAPRFVAAPSDVIVKEGQLVRLDCRVSGRPYPDVTWFKNGSQVQDDWTHKLVVNEGGMHSLMIMHAMVDDSAQYTCVARNISGEAHFSVSVTVEESDRVTAPSFVQKLINRQIKEGESVTLQARAVGMPTPMMTWHKGAREIFPGENYRIDTNHGVTTLTIDSATLGDSDWYQCTARNSVGTSSTKAKISVEAPPRDLTMPGGFFVPRVTRRPQEADQPVETVNLRPVARSQPSYVRDTSEQSLQKPAFTSLLNDLELYEGDRARFESCLIPIGDGTLRVEWYHNGQLIPSDSRHIFGNNFGFVSLDIINLSSMDSGVYTCRAINAAGEAVTTATLRCHSAQPQISHQFSSASAMPVIIPQQVQKPLVSPKPQFSKQLRNIDGARESTTVTFEAQINSADDQLMKVEWFRNGQSIQMSERFDMKFMFGRAVLTIKQLRVDDSGVYMVKAHNGAGNIQSTATLHVQPQVERAPALPAYSSGANVAPTYGNDLQRATGYSNSQKTTTYNTSSTTVIQTAPTFMRHLEPDYNVLEGSRLHMEVRAEPTQGQDLQFTWLKNGAPIQSDHRVRTSFAEGYAAIDILTVYPEDAGVYTLRVANAAGEAFTSTTLHCIPTPQPQRQTSQYSESTLKLERQTSSTLTNTSAYVPQPQPLPQPTGPAQFPVFTQPLQDVRTKQGSAIHLETRLIPVGDSTLTVLWYKDGQPLQAGARFKTINDWGHVALDFLHSYPEDSGVYTCRAINAFGEAAVNCKVSVQGEGNISYESSTAANLDHIKQLEDWRNRDNKPREVASNQIPPRLVKPLHPSHTIPETKNAHFECQIQAADGVQVAWYKNGQPVTASSRIRTVNDFGYVALDIIGVRPDDAGDWTCIIKNQAGQIDTRTSLNVLTEASMLLGTDNPDRLNDLQRLEDKRVRSTKEISPQVERPQFRTPLHNFSGLVEGAAVHLETRLTPINEPTQKVEWFHNGRPLLNSSRIKTVYDFGFVALDIANLHPGDSGNYMVRATNAAGEAVQTCHVEVRGEGNILNQPINAQSLQQIQRLEDAERGPYPIPDQVVATMAPRFLSQIKNVDIAEDQPAHFECRLEPLNDANLRVEWFKDGVPLNASHRCKTTYDFGYVALHIVGAQSEDTGRYTVVAHNQLGRVEQSADLLVRGKKLISFETQNPEGLQKIQQLEAWRNASHRELIGQDAPSSAPRFVRPLQAQNSNIAEGQKAHFEAKLEGFDSKTHVEWFLNGRPVAQGSRFRFVNEFGYIALTISDMRPEDAGEYLVRAYNDMGEDVTATGINVQGRKGLLTDTLHANSLNKIQALENYEPVTPSRLDDRPTVQRPMFTVPLRNHEVFEGEKVHLESRLIPVGCKVEWFHNNRPVDTGSRFGVTNDFGFVAMDINSVRPEDSGTYVCRAKNELGEAVATCSVIVKDTESMLLGTAHPDALPKLQALESHAPRRRDEIETLYGRPVFTIPLQPNVEIQEGQPVRLHCQLVPVGDPTLKVEWFMNGMPLRTGSRFLHLNQFGHVGLDVSQANAEDSGLYTVKATNAAGEAITSTSVRCSEKSSLLTATLHPESLPQIQRLEQHPDLPMQETEIQYGPPHFVTTLRNQEDVKENATAHFECRLEPSRDPTMKVEWYLNGRPLLAANRAKLTQDFGFVALDLTQITEDDSGVYMARAFNNHGEAFTSGRLVCQGSRGILSATQASDLALQRIAQFDAAQSVTFTSESKMYQPDDGSGMVPRFTSAPKDLNLKEGDVAHVHCNVTPTNDSNLQILWFKNGQPLVASSRIKNLNDFGFIVLEISGIQTEDAGQYTCIARNNYGEDRVQFTVQCSGKRGILFDTQHPESLEKIRRLEEPSGYHIPEIPDKAKQIPKILSPLRPAAVDEGASAHFETRISPTDDVDMKVEWFVNGRPLQAGHRVKQINDFGFLALDILYTRLEDFGNVTVRVHNSLGVDETSTQLTQLGVGPKQCPRFVTSFQNVNNAKEGDSIHLQATLEPANDSNLTVEWYWNGKPIIHGSRVKAIHDFGFVVLEISPIYGEDSGTYSCIARNEAGEAVTTASVLVESKKGLIFDSQLPADMRDSSMQKIQQLESASLHAYIPDQTQVGPTIPPRFLSAAHDVEVKEGAMAHFELRVEPSNDNTLRIEWFHNGKPIDVGSRFSRINDFGFVILEISGVKGQDAGTYTCVARNALGEARSEVHLKVQTFKNIVYDSSQPASLRKLQELEQSMDSQHLHPVMVDQPDELPRFTSQLNHHVDLSEGDVAHFEARIEPTSALVEWFRNGRPIVTGSRIRNINDFGFVMLEINGVTPNDTGTYTCRAKTSVGVAETSTDLRVNSKKSIILESQMPGGANLARLRELEMPSAPLPEEKSVVRQAPHFITQLSSNVKAVEGNTIHIDCRVEPLDCQIEWFFNGQPLRSGHRFKMTNDFGYVSLDILYVYAEDSGEYVARAVNELGEDVTRSVTVVTAKESVITTTQLPEGMEKGVERLDEIERELLTKGPIPYDSPDDRKQRSKPEFTVKPRPVEIKEGEPAKFECKVAGYPKPRVSWMLNGQLVISGSRFKISFDGLMNTLEIPRTRQYDAGEIVVVAQNPEGSTSTITTLTITTHSDYRTVLKQSTHTKGKIPVPDNFQSHLQKSQNEQNEGIQIDLRSTHRQSSLNQTQQPRPNQQIDITTRLTPQRQTSTDITIDFKQQQTSTNQWQQQQQQQRQQTSTNQWQQQQQQVVPPSPPVQSQPIQQENYSRETNFSSVQQTNLTQQQQQYQQVPQQQPPAPAPKPRQPPSPVSGGSAPPWLRQQGSVKQESEQPSWVSGRKTSSPQLPPKSQSPSITLNQQGLERSVQEDTVDITRKRVVQGQTQAPQQPIATGSEDLQMSAQESEYTQRLQKGNLTEIRYVQQRETSESKRQSVQKVIAAGQGPLPADLQAPKFVQRLEPCRVSEGKSAQFVCRFSGKPTPRIEWYRENFQIVNSPDFQVTNTQDSSTLYIPEVYLEDSGNFTVKAINDGGMSQSTANLIVEEAYSGESSGPTPPSFSDTVHDTKAKAGEVVRMEARVHGSLPISISWFKNGQKLTPSHRLKPVRDNDLHQLMILDATTDDSGWYDCVAVNEGGEARCSGQLSIEGTSVVKQQAAANKPTAGQVSRPEVTQLPQDVTVYEGESATFRASIVGTPQPEVRWYRGTNVVKNSKYFRTFVSGNICTLVITEAFHEDEGEYKCVARSPAGEVSCSAHLKVLVGETRSDSTVRVITYASNESTHMVRRMTTTTTTEEN